MADDRQLNWMLSVDHDNNLSLVRYTEIFEARLRGDWQYGAIQYNH